MGLVVAPLGVAAVDDDVTGLQELLLYGLKGMAAYAHHARQMNRADPAVDAFTVEALAKLCPDAPVVEKKHFSCVAAQCLPDSLMARRQVVLVGMEAHVCVLQTALELKAAGKEVFVVTDGISSRAQHDLDTALLRYQQAGVWLVSREMVLFELLRSSGDPMFRQMSQRYLVGK